MEIEKKILWGCSTRSKFGSRIDEPNGRSRECEAREGWMLRKVEKIVVKCWENFTTCLTFYKWDQLTFNLQWPPCPPDNRDNIWTMSAHLKFNSRFNILTLLQNTADTFFFIVAKINDQSTLNPHSKPTINMVLHYNAEGLRM